MDCEHHDTTWNERGRCVGRTASVVEGHAVQAGPEEWEESAWLVCPLAMLDADGVGGRPRVPAPESRWLNEVFNLRVWLDAGRPLDDFSGPLTAAASDALLVLDGECAAREKAMWEAARVKGGGK